MYSRPLLGRPQCRLTRLPRLPPVPKARRLSSEPPNPGPEREARKRQALRLSKYGFAATGGILGAALLLGLGDRSVHADADAEEDKHKRPTASLGSLIRTYVVYAACSFPTLVDAAPTVLNTLLSIPGVKHITEAVVRATFFSQFVGADTAQECIPLLKELRAENKGCLFAYSVEVDEAEAAGVQVSHTNEHEKPPHKQAVEEMINCINVAADFEDGLGTERTGRRTWVAVKLTALLPDAQTLVNFSSYLVNSRPRTKSPIAFPGYPVPTDLDILASPSPPAKTPLTTQDIVALKELYDDMFRICSRAQERGVKVIIDAEYTWYQPAVDAYAHALMRHFNRLPSTGGKWKQLIGSTPVAAPAVQPLIYQTYQAYLRRTLGYLQQSLEDARENGFALGVKLVRGAYHPHELAAHPNGKTPKDSSDPSLQVKLPSISPDPEPPVWLKKSETDACYNACLRVLVEGVAKDVKARGRNGTPTIGVLFGTHNTTSAELVLEEIVQHGLGSRTQGGEVVLSPEVTERINMGQLYGMCWMSDELTDYLASKTKAASPFVLKYVPYGALKDVMPYLSRRAIENKSVLFDGAAAKERQRAWNEIKRRIFG
ncbi:FAD-linked oxidoreductase [Punctularia strigosozonata HHB-11173 SS5]|uniref:FAD-linked oxidoreductase n=1 Tax=Punctularia strigosozonata (strain HHB-11173) TaxID=741275 RepID=UPI0004418662|nr:FAD-linked oxidoreductase [Punctularia strigosozonata HHB-11173 SS5]EIN13286.1 FAD-linked oxidoreductase [Punctularia strigosozonata HHB-11173 SS5]